MLRLSLTFLGWFILFQFQAVVAQSYLWPTNSGNYLSATFGETRSAHFHAGLDIKTWGREGYRVYATKDGTLSRLQVTERGYGNVIYLKHEDDSYSVYAHLQRFNEPFKSIADSIRLQDYSFEMEARFDSLEIKVQQGDLIGFTGSTGIGPPHLHFELRDSLQRPFNALTKNFQVKDELPPVFSSLIVEPLNANSRVDGNPISLQKRAAKKSETEYDFGEVRVHGKTGLAVNVFDRANDVHNAYAIYTLSLLHKGDTLFHERLNKYSYDQTGEMFLDRIAPFGSTRRGHQRLFAKDGHNNPFYLITRPEAEIITKEHPTIYRIIASDYFGNTATAVLTIMADSIQNIPANSGFSNTRSPSEWFWSENWVSPDLKTTVDLTRDDLGFPWREQQQIIKSTDSTRFLLARIHPEKSQIITTPDYQMKLWFGKNTFFDTLSVASSYGIIDHEYHLSIQPQMLASKNPYKIEFYMGQHFETGNNYRLFRIKKSNNKLSYVPSTLIGRTLHAMPDELGEFVIKPDNTPPEIADFTIYKTDYGMWQASVQVTDELTGINSESAWFSINGERGIAEYDYEEELLIFYLPGFEPKEENAAQIKLQDNAGNEQTVVLEYSLPGIKTD